MVDELYKAAIFGDFDAVKKIVAMSPEVVNNKDKYGFTVLHGLAEEENLEIMQYLIDYGANVNVKNDEGITPLHLAGWADIVKLLIKNGANLESVSKNGETPLVNLASEQEREDVIEALLQAGANVNAKNARGETALDIAISRGENEKICVIQKYAE